MIDPLIAVMNRLMWGDLSAYGFQRPPLGLKATVENEDASRRWPTSSSNSCGPVASR